MRTSLLSPILLTAAVAFSSSTAAAQTQLLDVEQADTSAVIAGFHQPDLAQSFKPTVNLCSGSSAFLSLGWGTTGTLTIELWDALPTGGAGNLLASGSAPATAGAWSDVFWPAVSVTPGTEYFLVYSCTNGAMALGGSSSDTYLDGMTHAGLGFQEFPTLDYAFRTWYENTLDLSISGTCPGPMTITISGATPNGNVAVLYGNAGSFTMPNDPCGGITLDLDFPNLAGLFQADANGDLILSPSIPSVICGWNLQVVDATNCAISNVLTF